MKNPIKWLTRALKQPRPDPWNDFWFNLQTQNTKTGLDINEDIALRYSAVWACVRVISEDLASLPLITYRRQGKGKERADELPLYRLLHDAPNPEMSAMQFREALQAHVLTWGNCYAEIQRNLRGEPMALWPLRPDKMQVKRDESNELYYEYYLTDSADKVRFKPGDILHVAGLGFNGLIGYSPISYQREAIALGVGAEEFGARYFANDATPPIVLKHPGTLSEQGLKRLKEGWQAAYGGLSNKHRAAVLEEGITVESIGLPNRDSQFVESRKFQVNEIARIFRVPPHKIMDLERATFSNIENQDIDYTKSTIRPWAVRWEQAINQRLLLGSEQYFVEHLLAGLMRGDLGSRYAAYAIGRQWGWLSINDIRALENMNPVANGDDYLQPMNMAAIGEQLPIADEAQIVTDDEESQRKLRLLRRQ